MCPLCRVLGVRGKSRLRATSLPESRTKRSRNPNPRHNVSLITLYTAEPGNGKTYAALVKLKASRAVVFVPTASNKNELLSKIPWVFLRDLTPKELERLRLGFKQFRVVISCEEAGQLAAFMSPQWEGWAFVLDDLPQLFYNKPAQAQVDRFAAGIRHRDGQLVITTQRILGFVPPFCRAVADEIFQVGPLIEQTEARCLYYMGGSSRYPVFKDFYKAIATNPQYGLFPIKQQNK